MSHGNLLVVIAAVLIGAVGAYSTTMHESTGHQLSAAAEQTATPESLKLPQSVPAENSPVETDASASSTKSKAPTDTITSSTKTTKTASTKSAPKKQSRGTAVTTKMAANGGAKSTQGKSQNPEVAAVEAATKAFISASKSGNASAIARTAVKSMSKGLLERKKWASGAGMDEYKEFGRDFVRIINTNVTGDAAEVKLAMKIEYEGTDSMYRKVEKFNRTEGFVSLQKENGKWKVSGNSYGRRVWNE